MKIKKALIPLALTALLAFGAAPVLAGDIISPATTGTPTSVLRSMPPTPWLSQPP